MWNLSPNSLPLCRSDLSPKRVEHAYECRWDFHTHKNNVETPLLPQFVSLAFYFPLLQEHGVVVHMMLPSPMDPRLEAPVRPALGPPCWVLDCGVQVPFPAAWVPFSQDRNPSFSLYSLESAWEQARSLHSVYSPTHTFGG